jgi:xanthine dehydrogenase small subunit
MPLRCVQTENALRNKAIDADSLAAARAALAAEISPIDDLRSTRNYRLRVSLNLLQDFLQSLRMAS